MTEPMHDTPLSVGQTYAKTLREIAAMANNPEVKRRIALLGEQLERTFEHQADTATVVIAGIEQRMNERVDQLHNDIVALSQVVWAQAGQTDMTLKLLIELERRYFPQTLPDLVPPDEADG